MMTETRRSLIAMLTVTAASFVPAAGLGQTTPNDAEEPWQPADIVAFALDKTTVCAVTKDNRVDCYDFEQRRRFTPEAQFQHVALHMSGYRPDICGIRPDGTLECLENTELTDVPVGTFKDVQMWSLGACALSEEGFLSCWGNISEIVETEPELVEQLRLNPERAAPDDKFRSFSLKGTSACGVRADGTTLCWSIGFLRVKSARTRLARPMQNAVVQTNLGGVACGLLVSGGVRCWGPDTPRFGDDRFGDEREGSNAEALDQEYVSVVRSAKKPCALRPDGKVDCAQDGERETLEADEPFANVILGYNLSCGRTRAGGLVCWDTDASPSTPKPFE